MKEYSSVSLPEPVLVFGTSSLVGSQFVEEMGENSKLYGAGRRNIWQGRDQLKDFWQVDVTDEDQVRDVVRKFPGQYVFNFAAETAVGSMEKTRPVDPFNLRQLDANLGYRVNVLGSKNLALACKESDKTLIHTSTDFVFDGNEGPYGEDSPVVDSPDLVSWYGWTKAKAEKVIKQSGARSIVIRISYPYRKSFEGKGDVVRNFLDMYDKFKKGEILALYPAFEDQLFTPTLIDDIPNDVSLIISKNESGIFHIASPDVVNFRTFLCEVLRVARGVENPEDLIGVGSIVDFFAKNPTAAKWPKNGGLKVDRIVSLGFTPTSFKDGIRKAFGT